MPRISDRGLWLRRLSAAARQRPGGRQWLETALLAGVFAAIALPVARAGGLVTTGVPLSAGTLLPLALRVMILPALLEEVVFRVLLNPHPTEAARAPRCWTAGLLSLAVYVLAHPLGALVNPARGAVFLVPQFLLLAALLGLACLLLYRRSGSLWPPVALHWFVVVSWFGMGGHGLLPLP